MTELMGEDVGLVTSTYEHIDMVPLHDGYRQAGVVQAVPSSAELNQEAGTTDVPLTVTSITVSLVHVEPHTPHVPTRIVELGGIITGHRYSVLASKLFHVCGRHAPADMDGGCGGGAGGSGGGGVGGDG
jgi:hypothetical protein